MTAAPPTEPQAGAGADDPNDAPEVAEAAEPSGAAYVSGGVDVAEATVEQDAADRRAGTNLVADAAPIGPGARTGRRRARQRRNRRRAGFALVVGLSTLAVPLLGFIGFRTVLVSTDGRVVDTVLEPSEEGYQAVVDPTPVEFVVHVDDDGRVLSLTVLALGAGDEGGSVLFVPIETLTDPDTHEFGFDRLSGAFLLGGLDGVRGATSQLLGTSFSDSVEVDSERWAELVAPVAPLVLENPDDVGAEDDDGEPEVVFPAGTLTLQADDVGRYLALRDPNETDTARLARHQLFWEAWLKSVAAASDLATAVPGEGGGGVARFVRGLATGDVAFETLPVEPEASLLGAEGLAAAPDTVAEVVSRMVPLPTAPSPGGRVRVRVLNGTPEEEATREVIARLVPAGAEISVVGNADRFTYLTTAVTFSDGAREGDARRMREALEIGSVAFERSANDSVDVTIVVGLDFLVEAGLKSDLNPDERTGERSTD
ncbi:hypothetical protein BH18ACT4_BH18ACT4_09340 [soil metagenome]